MTEELYAKTMYTIARIYDVGMDLLWRQEEWVQSHPSGRWHIWRRPYIRTKCGRVFSRRGILGIYPSDVSRERMCKQCAP